MIDPSSRHSALPTLPASVGGSGFNPIPRSNPDDEHPPRRPDWLLLLVIGLFLTTLLIAWLVDFPTLFR